MLHVIMYHYIRDARNTRFPALKFLDQDQFRRQVLALESQFEMATLETALASVSGQYSPARELCLLTFDDGLREHYDTVFPLLAEAHIQGIFCVITSALEERAMAPVHMSHLLMAELGFEAYRARYLAHLDELRPGFSSRVQLDPALVARTYTWDQPAVGWFKYLVNFTLDPLTSDSIVRRLFNRHFGSEADFAGGFYLSWNQTREMIAAGMVAGGHTHRHRPLASLAPVALHQDLTRSTQLLHSRLPAQAILPFCYPYGKETSFTPHSVRLLQDLGYGCAFTTEKGANKSGASPFRLRRVDCKDAPVPQPLMA